MPHPAHHPSAPTTRGLVLVMALLCAMSTASELRAQESTAGPDTLPRPPKPPRGQLWLQVKGGMFTQWAPFVVSSSNFEAGSGGRTNWATIPEQRYRLTSGGAFGVAAEIAVDSTPFAVRFEYTRTSDLGFHAANDSSAVRVTAGRDGGNRVSVVTLLAVVRPSALCVHSACGYLAVGGGAKRYSLAAQIKRGLGPAAPFGQEKPTNITFAFGGGARWARGRFGLFAEAVNHTNRFWFNGTERTKRRVADAVLAAGTTARLF